MSPERGSSGNRRAATSAVTSSARLSVAVRSVPPAGRLAGAEEHTIAATGWNSSPSRGRLLTSPVSGRPSPDGVGASAAQEVQAGWIFNSPAGGAGAPVPPAQPAAVARTAVMTRKNTLNPGIAHLHRRC
jgi:hypothetical protein